MFGAVRNKALDVGLGRLKLRTTITRNDTSREILQRSYNLFAGYHIEAPFVRNAPCMLQDKITVGKTGVGTGI